MKTKDGLFMVGGKMVTALGEGSDDWKEQMRKQMAKQFPGIKP